MGWTVDIHQFDTYKKLAGISGDGGTRLLACLGREVYSVLFSAYRGTISDQNEKTLKENIMRLAGQMST